MTVTLAVSMAPLAVLTPPALPPPSASGAQAGAVALPACPLVFGHGGYPTTDDARDKDRVRQPNNPSAVNDQKTWGAQGVEGDVQLTKRGRQAVMWHNPTTAGLTGDTRRITATRWTAGTGSLRDRRIARGPYRGERVYSLREWLDHVKSRGLIALLEIKPRSRSVLADPALGARAWREISDPIRDRQDEQRIMVYSQDPWIQRELAARHPALLRGSAARWTDSVAWDEPVPPWTGNTRRWQAVLAQAPKSVMTNYTKEYRAWLAGRCR
ncbi:glycerophosphoryl diester phosphodiesterase [Thermocatellispora tengchongensis]|uniref:Glycerophosphoryl diester phosphodiesterase n=1 Tax=Thermocatellispora tengchongensis TaxID=1073253 RepID=A0A840P6U5_9ACTN|nr:glycerophosphodiester phosphodiesterase family protein [Thermocatellispora tengchongensis]MBB5133581.1 glycerophosphoryl diester phosphodiesterase [Thermocatellispora tengchongensis]